MKKKTLSRRLGALCVKSIIAIFYDIESRRCISWKEAGKEEEISRVVSDSKLPVEGRGGKRVTITRSHMENRVDE